MTHPIENIMKSTMEEIRSMVDVNTVIGSPILPGTGPMILPVSKVSLGFLSGGGEYCGNNGPVKRAGTVLAEQKEENGTARYPFAGTGVAGMSITPMAFLTVNGNSVKVMPAQYKNSWDRAIDLLPETASLVEKIVSDTAEQGKRSAAEETEGNA